MVLVVTQNIGGLVIFGKDSKPFSKLGLFPPCNSSESIIQKVYNKMLYDFLEMLFQTLRSQLIILCFLDNENPTIVCPSNQTESTEVGKNYSTVTLPSSSPTDNVGVASVVSTPASGTQFNMGTTTVTYVATDHSGNTANCTFNVTVSSE